MLSKWMLGSVLLLLAIGAAAGAVATSPGAGQMRLVRQRERVAGPIGLAVWDYAAGESRGRLFVVELDPRAVDLSVRPGDAPRPLAHLVRGEGELAAVNGGFYDQDERPMGLVVSNGRRHARLRKGGGSGAFFVRDGAPGIAHRSDPRLAGPLDHAVQSIDRLVDGGRSLVKARPRLPRDARSAVAIDGAGRVFFVVAIDEQAIVEETDEVITLGPRTTSTGPTLHELAGLLARPVEAGGLGAAAALNLDGGFSTALQVRVPGRSLEIRGFRGTINAVVATPRR